MPALGMAQDSAVIVAWHKAPGDAVKASDILMEVETDKSTMEVEAGHDGYVAELRAEAGDEVPVGDVIAVISTDKPTAPRSAQGRPEGGRPGGEAGGRNPRRSRARARRRPRPRRPRRRPPPRAAASSPRPRPAASRPSAASTSRSWSGRASRSPTTWPISTGSRPRPRWPRPPRRASATWRRRSPRRPSPSSSPGPRPRPARPARAGLLAAFAAAALRATGEAPGTLTVALSRPGSGTALYADPDLSPLGQLAPEEDGTPSITLRDLAATRLTAARFAADAGPVLTLSRAGPDTLRLALDAPAGSLSDDAALALVDGLAARLEMPLRQLL